jgi:hypothetical protein
MGTVAPSGTVWIQKHQQISFTMFNVQQKMGVTEASNIKIYRQHEKLKLNIYKINIKNSKNHGFVLFRFFRKLGLLLVLV